MGLSQELQTGKAGEHLVCCDLIQQGYNVFLTDQGLPYDVVVDTDKGIRRIQVKTISKEQKDGYRFSLRTGKRAGRLIPVGSFDYVAFAFLDKRVVQYIPVDILATEKGMLKQSIVFHSSQNEFTDMRGKWGGKARSYIIGRFNNL